MRQHKCHLPVIFGIVLFEIRANGIQICNSLCPADARLQMPDDLEEPASAAFVQITVTVKLFLVDQRQKEIRMEKHQSPVKFRRRHAEDREGMFVHLHYAPDYTGIIFKMRVPVRIAEHQVRCTVRTMLIGLVKEATEIRLDL